MGFKSKAEKHQFALSRAVQFVRAGNLDKAEDVLWDLVKPAPHKGEVFGILGKLLDRLEKHRQAYPYHKAAISLEPGNAGFWRYLGRCLRHLQKDKEAVIALERAVALRPADADCLLDLSRVYAAAGQFEAAVTACDQAIAVRPDVAIAYSMRGSHLQSLGKFEVALQDLDRALDRDPHLTEVYMMKAHGHHFHSNDDQSIRDLRHVLAAADLSPDRRSTGHFALAKFHDRQRNHDEAFEHYKVANEIKKKTWRMDRKGCRLTYDQTMAGYKAETFEVLKEAGSNSEAPIFIVGMPRSGSTLVEQIISSHPDVAAGGEIRVIRQLVSELTHASDTDINYPRDAASMNVKYLAGLRDLYLSSVRISIPDKTKRFTDKMPINYVHLGLIAVLFPMATIINCKRDPRDTCLSCYFQNFSNPDTAAVSNDLADLGFLYRQYQRLMAHWIEVLPVPILEIQYEELIANQEETSRRILEFAGLDWVDACLDFHKADRGVGTASKWQVRQPIYKSSAGRWRRYENHLKPLLEALEMNS
ncbi:MAG: tetratricopeptide repeat-containing sulfotransferase family protein [Methyloligellaceae bacterium]